MRHTIYLLGLVLILTIVPAVSAAGALQQDSPPLPAPLREATPWIQPGSESVSPSPEAPVANIVPWARMVFQSYRDNNWEIYRANPDGSGATRLTNNPALDKDARLNRGATRIVFASDRAGGDFDIFAMNADGSAVTALTNDSTPDQAPVWSPDGVRVAFESYRHGIDNGEVYVMNANGSGQTRLTNSPGYDGSPSWSPDGNKIAFVSNRSGPYRIMVMNADGSSQQVLSNQQNAYDPVWSPDGRQIAYDADNDGDNWEELWLMNADGSNQHMIYNPSGDVVAWARSWSPDGRYLAFSEIVLVNVQGNWYWTTGRVRVWDSANPGSIQDLTPGNREWKPDLETADAAAPTSSIQALPAQSPGPFTVRWSGTDTGGAGIKNYDVQVKDGVNGSWTIWLAGTTASNASYPGVGGHTYYFRSQARDNAFNTEAWPVSHDAMTTVESLPPRSTVETLPEYSRNGVEVRWGGVDSGGSGIKSYDVQTRQDSRPWANWKTNTTDTAAAFSGAAGSTFQFRARARDNAQNLEAWPTSADTTTVLYTWGISGRVTDNRGAPVTGVAVATTPAAFHVQQSDSSGNYAAHVIAQAASYTAVWSKAGYGGLPQTAYPSAPDALVNLVLPPADNWVQNPDFETGSLSPAWQATGSPAPVVATSASHTGRYGALLQATGSAASPDSMLTGLTTIAQQMVVPSSVAAPTLSFAYWQILSSPSTGDGFEVEVEAGGNTTTVFMEAVGANGWRYHWVDLTPWSGQAITVRFRLVRVSVGSASVYIDEVTTGSAHPDLWVSGVSGAAPAGALLHTALDYGNRGGVDAQNGKVILQLPAGLTFVSADPPPTATTPVLRWNLASAPGFSQQTINLTLQMSASASYGSTLNTTASIASDTVELETGNNTASGPVFVGSRGWLPLIVH